MFITKMTQANLIAEISIAHPPDTQPEQLSDSGDDSIGIDREDIRLSNCMLKMAYLITCAFGDTWTSYFSLNPGFT